MSGLIEVFFSDRGRTASWSRHGGVLRLCFCTVWYCVELCGAVSCVVELCVVRLCSHGRACQGSCRPSFRLIRDYIFCKGLRKTVAAGENKSLLGAGVSTLN